MNEKSIIIAGNGPSLAMIDYRRIPPNIEIFRVNNFYFEDKYYLGKQVDYYLVGIMLLPQQFYNAQYLIKNKEYDIKNIYINNHNEDFFESQNISNFFPTVQSLNPLIAKIPKIVEFFGYNEYYFNKLPTAGTLAIATAIALGYKTIYLTGIDFYSKEQHYVFENGKNFLKIRESQNFKIQGLDLNTHSIDIEKEFIQMVQTKLNIQMYSLSDHTAMNSLIPLAPEIYENNTPNNTLLDKPKNYLHDWLDLPTESVYIRTYSPCSSYSSKGILQHIKQLFIKLNLQTEWEYLRNNMICRWCLQVLHVVYSVLKAPILLVRVFIKFIYNLLFCK